MPHATGASNYAYLLRHMLIHEEGNELHLLKAVPDWWLENGQEIRIQNAPTHFGEVSLTVRGTDQGLEVSFSGAKRNKPQRIVLHTPDNRPVNHPPEELEVATRTPQKMRWDMDVVIDKYKAHWDAQGGKPAGIASPQKDF